MVKYDINWISKCSLFTIILHKVQLLEPKFSFDLLKNVRCSEEIWTINGITFEEALEKAKSDPKVKALHWYKNNEGDGRISGVKGWYQGAGGSLGTVVNNNWDTILLNNFK